MKRFFFKSTTAVLAILLAVVIYQLNEKEIQLQSTLFQNECLRNQELANAFQELLGTQIKIDEQGNTSLAADEEYFEEHNIPLKYYEVIKRSAEQLGKDYKKMKKEAEEEYGNVNMPSIQEVITQQYQAYLENKKQQ